MSGLLIECSALEAYAPEAAAGPSWWARLVRRVASEYHVRPGDGIDAAPRGRLGSPLTTPTEGGRSMSGKYFGLVAAVGGVGLWLATASTAQAIPANQARCSTTIQLLSASATFSPLSNLDVRVNNGTVARTAIVHLSADVSVDPATEVRIAYSVDGGAPTVFGPSDFANHQEFGETRATVAVIPLAAGTHDIRPVWRVNGIAGKQGAFFAGCVTVESATR